MVTASQQPLLGSRVTSSIAAARSIGQSSQSTIVAYSSACINSSSFRRHIHRWSGTFFLSLLFPLSSMSKFQQMKRQQAAALAAANNKLPAGIKSSKATIEEDTTTTTTTATTTTTTVAATTSSAPTTTATTDIARLTSLYPLPVATKADARRRWNLDNTSTSSSLLPSATSTSLLSHRDISFPSGYLTGDYDTQPTPSSQTVQKTADLVYQSAMNTALAPGKQLLMTAFMLWMSGNTLQIFSIMMLGMALYQPLQRMVNVQAEFARYGGHGAAVSLLWPQVVFVACNLAGVGLALYKCQSMGLLPTSSADWLSTQVRPVVEFSGGGASYV